MYLAGNNIKVGSEVEGTPVAKLSDVYSLVDEGLPVYEVTKGEKGFRVLKEVSEKELKKALSETYKRLDIAIFFNQLAEVKKIYALKTPVKRSSEYSLCYAVKTGNLNIVKAVFESGELDLESYYVREALEVACELGLFDIVKYLIKGGLNPCSHQFYPLIWARKSGNQELIDFLEKDIKKRLGELPEIKDPYELLLEKKANEKPVLQTIEEEPDEKPNGRGSVKVKLADKPKKVKKEEKPKKEIKSLEELKAMSAKLLKEKKKKIEKPKVEKSPKNKEEPKKKVLTLEELKARSKALLKDKAK